MIFMSEAGNLHQKELRDQRRSAGLCIYCGVPARPNRVSCETCGRKMSEYAKKSYRKRVYPDGNVRDRRGRKNRYEYIAWRGGVVVIQGSSKKLAKYFGMTVNQLCNYARLGLRWHGGPGDPVLIERRRIDE